MAETTASGSGTMRVLRIVLWGLVLLALTAVGWWKIGQPMLGDSLADTLGHGDYRLMGTDGQPFTEDTLKGGPTAVYFGFTHCPEVCPTTLADITVWQEELGAAADDLRIYFITVDPERDTLEMMGDYVGWVPNAVGVSGPRAEIDKAIRAFKIYARQVPIGDDPEDYTMDHSAYVMLFDENGRFTDPIVYQEDFDSALAKLRRLLGD